MQRPEWTRCLMVVVIVWGAALAGGHWPRGTTLVQASAQPGPVPPVAVQTVVWEYKIVRVTEELLNQAGAEGWEVVAAVGDVKGQSAGMRAINTTERAILKRPRRTEGPAQ